MTSSSEGEILQPSQIIRDRWKIKGKVGGGGFGEIYEAVDLQNHNERVAVKVESSKATKQVLKMEVAVLRRLQGKRHACKFYGCGRNDKFNYLVMSLQGKNLADLRRESPRQCFSPSTAFRIASQILVSIREIHSIGFLHRDIKPSNFAMGRTNSTQRNVYMLDFGLARLYLNAKGEIRSPRSAAGFRGTVRYAAVSAHKNKEMGRQDDLWSLFYMLAEFLQGALPWRRIKDKDEVGRMKEEVNFEQLLEGCPPELIKFPNYLSTLAYADEPDYNMLDRLLMSIILRFGIEQSEPFDWENSYENAHGRSKIANPTNMAVSQNAALPAVKCIAIGTTTTNAHAAVNANISTRMRSHTTAVRDRAPDDKNRALDTQAPITMGEDDDEQTGYCRFYSPLNGSGGNATIGGCSPLSNFNATTTSTAKVSQHDSAYDHESSFLLLRQDKPKYKRQEFLRPKYGPVNFDVIDAVNARLAAASQSSTAADSKNGKHSGINNKHTGSSENIFQKIKIEQSEAQSVEKHDVKHPNRTERQMPSPSIPRSLAPAPESLPTSSRIFDEKSSTHQPELINVQVTSTLSRQYQPQQPNNKSIAGTSSEHHNKNSVSLSTGRRYQNGSKRHVNSVNTSVNTNFLQTNSPVKDASSSTNSDGSIKKNASQTLIVKVTRGTNNVEKTIPKKNEVVRSALFVNLEHDTLESTKPQQHDESVNKKSALPLLKLEGTIQSQNVKINDRSSGGEGGGYFSGATTVEPSSSRNSFYNGNCVVMSSDSTLRGYLTPISARKSATMLTLNRPDPQQNQYTQHNYTPLLESINLNNECVEDKRGENNSFASPHLHIPFSRTANSVDERNHCDEYTQPPLLPLISIAQPQHYAHVHEKLKHHRRNQSASNFNKNGSETQQPALQQQQPYVQKHYRNLTSGSGLNLMSHFKNLVNSFNNLSTHSSARRRSMSRGVSLDDAARCASNTNINISKSALLKINGVPAIFDYLTTPISSPTSGVDTANSTGVGDYSNIGVVNSKKPNNFVNYDNYQNQYLTTNQHKEQHYDNVPMFNENNINKEREMQSKRCSQRRRSNSQNLFLVTKKEASLSPTRRRQVVHKTMIVNSENNKKECRNNGALKLSKSSDKMENCAYKNVRTQQDDSNGRSPIIAILQPTQLPFDDRNKSSLTCRRKRYQFLNFAPRALSKS